MKHLRSRLLALCSAVVLAACGGSSSGPEFKSVVVFGDSLADVGTFGLKFTVQKSGDAAGYPIWTQLVADAVGASGASQCPAYRGTPTGSFTPNTSAGCTNYAIGGGRVFNPTSQGGTASPIRVGTQMEAHAVKGYGSGSLVLIDGGGNDAADLVGAYLGAGSGGAGVTAYQTFLAQLIAPATLGPLLTQSGGPERAAGAYMVALADSFYASVRTQVLDRGARNVVILNIPDITLTPRFSAVLTGVRATAGAATATALQAGIRSWIKAYNDRLIELRGSDPRVAIVDFNANFSQQVSSPASFGLSNAVETACPIVGVDKATGLPAWDISTCSDKALDSQAGKTAGWWKTYAFSDGFHPTPLGHQLMSDAVLKAMRAAGWI